jgi:hypothetical protein
MNRSHIFLRCYAETGSITRAAEAAKIHRSIHYRRLKQDPKYKTAFDVAHEVAVAVLEDEAVRRAVEGLEEPLTYQGQFSYLPKVDAAGNLVLDGEGRPMRGKLITIRKYSDSLLQFLLRGAKPEKYRERFQHDVNANINVTKFKGSLEDLLATYRNLVAQENDQEAA